MICPACVMQLGRAGDELPGILFIKANYHKKRLEVEFDESRVSEQEIGRRSLT